MPISRAVSVEELLKKKFIELPVEGVWKELLGAPERSGSWFIYGLSGHGKTTFNMQLAKYLTRFGRVEYNTLEEGARKSMQEAVRENRMGECPRGSFKILDKLTIAELRDRLSRPRAAKIVFIDSVQYTFMTKADYKRLIKDFPDTLFVFVSHARGNQPLGALAEAIMYDADIKIHVLGFKAFSKSRMSRGVKTKPYVIWEEGSRDYHEII